MIRRITTMSLGSIFLLVLVFNGYLLFSAMDGSRIVQQVQSAAGHGLNCMELYQARAINTYFDSQRPREGKALYLLSTTWPIWFVLSIGVAFGLAGVIGMERRWHWLPVLSMSVFVLWLILYLPTIAKISCAID